MSELPKLKFGVVGCGLIGKRHAAIISGHPDCELAALCDVLPKSHIFPDSDPDVPFFTSLDDMLRADLDVVCICTPNGLHAAQSLAALSAGKHVVVEKPMGLTKASCEQVVSEALNRGKQVFCVMQNRYTPAAQWLKSVIIEGLLGDIYFVQVNCFWNRDERDYMPKGQKHPWKGTKSMDGGTLFTQFSHFVDMLYWVFGDIREVHAHMHNFAHPTSIEFEDTGVVQFTLQSGAMGSLNYSTAIWGSNMESSMAVIGSRGSLKISGQYMNEVVHCNIADYTMPDLPPGSPPNLYEGYTGSAANHHFVFQNVVDVLRGRQTTATNALEGMKVVDIIERMYLAGP